MSAASQRQALNCLINSGERRAGGRAGGQACGGCGAGRRGKRWLEAGLDVPGQEERLVLTSILREHSVQLCYNHSITLDDSKDRPAALTADPILSSPPKIQSYAMY
ncbi:hypothetical protein E2C01_008576 [Portunus trituberculatus]|uniref:Uncharacterized protein n=1 Tax=Portunus trituberculatus TaxID=210409 RepID=A0A5B7D4A5_PORTR|nr:hypothetical protein [Portunus trituberculatus]